jgi:alpha-mannosidase
LEFFQALERQPGLPVWNGELYFELHRGPYTGQSEIKRLNRCCETALHDTEFLCAWAADAFGAAYPYEQIAKAWQTVCLHQFHDILPGSSIHAVYVDAKAQYERVLFDCETLRNDALLALEALADANARILVVNATSFAQTDLVELPFFLGKGERLVWNGKSQTCVERNGKQFAWLDDVPPYGFAALCVRSGEGEPLREEPFLQAQCANGYRLENSRVVAEFDENGDLVRWFDRECGRELIPKGKKAAQWQLYEDRPSDWDAWESTRLTVKKGSYAPSRRPYGRFESAIWPQASEWRRESAEAKSFRRLNSER